MKIAMANKAEQKLSRINELAEQAAKELGLILLDLRFGQQGKSKSLIVSIYRKEPAIGFSDCEKMSKTLEHLLDLEEANQIALDGSYVLEVVSAGIERQLTTAFEFTLFAGQQVRIVAKEKIASFGTEFVGTLLGGDENSIVVSPGFSLSQKQSKKGKSIAPSDDATNGKLTLDLQQIYRIYLWPGP